MSSQLPTNFFKQVAEVHEESRTTPEDIQPLPTAFFKQIPKVPVESRTTPEDIQPYGRAHGEKLSPEQFNYLQPILEVCTDSLMEGESVLVLGSHGIAPNMLPYFTDTYRLAQYNAELKTRDYDLQMLSANSYNRFVAQFSPEQISTAYVYGVGIRAEVAIDLLDNEKFAREFVRAGRTLLPRFENVDTTVTKQALDAVQKGNASLLPVLNRLYAPDTIGVKLTKVNGELIPTVYDPLNILQTVSVNDEGYPVFDKAINENSLRFLFLDQLAHSQQSASPYASDLTRLPAILAESEEYEIISTSALIELPRLVKGGLTHEVSFSDRHIITAYNAARELARLNPYFAVQHISVARYVKSVQQTLVQNLDSFPQCLALMTEKFPMGWCISPEDLSTQTHIMNRTIAVSSIGIEANTLLGNLNEIVEQNGQPTTLEQALGMYLAADSGGGFDQVQFERNVDYIVDWWLPNFPNLDLEKVAQSYKQYNRLQRDHITSIQA